MILTLRAVFLIVAIILFVLSGLGVSPPRVSLLAFGLAFFAAAGLVP